MSINVRNNKINFDSGSEIFGKIKLHFIATPFKIA